MSILIVDDLPSIQLVLAAFLEDAGYTELLTAASAAEAFRKLGMDNPPKRDPGIDLILMDVMMPDTDGIEACRRIKAVPQLQDIPVIMMTGQGQGEHLEEAFASGAMDYITKPTNRAELGARVRSAMALKREMDRRKLTNLELEQESLAKTQILSTVTHELKSPLTSIVGYIDVILQQPEMVGPLSETLQEYLEAVQRNSYRLKALIDDLLDISRIEVGSLELNLRELEVQHEVDDVVLSLEGQANEKRIQVVLNIPPNLGLVQADRLRFCQVVTNLLSNAYKYSPVGSTVTIMAKEDPQFVHIGISDTGIGISKDDQSRLFTK